MARKEVVVQGERRCDFGWRFGPFSGFCLTATWQCRCRGFWTTARPNGLPPNEGLGRTRSRWSRPRRRQRCVCPPLRSEAVTLLSALQREARFVDIVKEPLDQYTDAQVGAAARDVLKDCGRVLERLFALRPLVEQPEGSELEAPAGYDAGRYRLVGKVQGEPPFRGRLVHPGWCVTSL